MMRCFRIPNKRRNAEEEEKSNAEFRFAQGRLEEESFMIKNGGLILEGLIASCAVNFTPFRIFSKRQLQIESNNFTPNDVVDGYLCRWYKRIFDDREVIFKTWKSRKSRKSWNGIEFSITEIVVGLQMNNHKNALKLLGYCSETPAPTLVFEFAENGHLSDHIYEDLESPLLSWENRLRIAIEVAYAISYLHTGTSRPIIHRNITLRNIFLDKHFVAKLGEFGFSVSIPLGETYVITNLAGNRGYLDPEYVHTGLCTEKIDVYSFAMVLFEILSGRRVSNFLIDLESDDDVSPSSVNGSAHLIGPEKDDDDDDVSPSSVNGLPDFIGPNKDTEQSVTSKLSDHIWNYFTANIFKERNKQKMACAELAWRCIAHNPDERPTMMEVAYELRRIKGIHPSTSQ